MAHRRTIAPARTTSGDALTADLVGIGMLVGGEGSREPNIEDAILFASMEGMEQGDLRVLALLVTWVGVHYARVNVDRLTRLVVMTESRRVRAFWSAVARWRSSDRRFVRLAQAHRGARVDLLATGTDFQVARHGEDPRFAGSKLRVPANVLRDRSADVLAPAELAREHSAYRWRLVIGPTYRADMWAALERQPELSAAALARATYGSFASAWQARKDQAAWRAAMNRLPPTV
ncbi:MAG TPA: hypothetical protein VFE30_04335 [Anaeromyxobacteraceae bacterium]|jgi:hypothetical protein|nr:hypothetical protein [Anaeromyxobacteraceae bacterium]